MNKNQHKRKPSLYFYTSNTDWFSLWKNQYYYPKVLLEKYYFDKDIEIYSNNSYYVESDEEYYEGKCRDLFLETIRKIWQIIQFKKIKNKNFFKPMDFKIPSWNVWVF